VIRQSVRGLAKNASADWYHVRADRTRGIAAKQLPAGDKQTLWINMLRINGLRLSSRYAQKLSGGTVQTVRISFSFAASN
jgi:hypothetical protein